MSDKDEPSASKRTHDSADDPKEEDDGENSDGWVGPLPTDAAPTKKRKGIPRSIQVEIQLFPMEFHSIDLAFMCVFFSRR